METAIQGSALEKKGWRWRGQQQDPTCPEVAPPEAWVAIPHVPGASPTPGQETPSQCLAPLGLVSSPPGCHQLHPCSSHVQKCGPSLLSTSCTPAVILGDVKVHVDGKISLQALETSHPPRPLVPPSHPHSRDLQERLWFRTCELLIMTAVSMVNVFFNLI